MYVIKSEEGFIYKGMTDNLERRLVEHNNKTLPFWAKRGKNWKLVYVEEFDSKTEALKREKWLKTGVDREYLKKFIDSRL
jgi:putative endonuclease